MKLAYVVDNKSCKYGNAIDKFSYINFRNTATRILSILASCCIGINFGAISVKDLLGNYYSSSSWNDAVKCVSQISSVSNSFMYYSCLIFSAFLLLYLLVENLTDTMDIKEFIRHIMGIIGRSVLVYLVYGLVKTLIFLL